MTPAAISAGPGTGGTRSQTMVATLISARRYRVLCSTRRGAQLINEQPLDADAEQLEESAEGLRLRAGLRPIDELVSIAATARAWGRQITFTGLEARALKDLLRLAGAGGRWEGAVRTSPRGQVSCW